MNIPHNGEDGVNTWPCGVLKFLSEICQLSLMELHDGDFHYTLWKLIISRMWKFILQFFFMASCYLVRKRQNFRGIYCFHLRRTVTVTEDHNKINLPLW
jgi:hypothetical protein